MQENDLTGLLHQVNDPDALALAPRGMRFWLAGYGLTLSSDHPPLSNSHRLAQDHARRRLNRSQSRRLLQAKGEPLCWTSVPTVAKKKISVNQNYFIRNNNYGSAEVLAEHGFRAATIRNICQRARANIAAVHYYFGDKEHRYAAVLRYTFRDVIEKCPLDLGLGAEAIAEERLQDSIRPISSASSMKAVRPGTES
jgi:hypothetical protein